MPKQQFLIKTPELAKVVNLSVDPKSYWLYTNDPYDNRRRQEAFATYGFVQGLEVLAERSGDPKMISLFSVLCARGDFERVALLRLDQPRPGSRFRNNTLIFGEKNNDTSIAWQTSLGGFSTGGVLSSWGFPGVRRSR